MLKPTPNRLSNSYVVAGVLRRDPLQLEDLLPLPQELIPEAVFDWRFDGLGKGRAGILRSFLALLEVRERWHRKLKEFGNLSHDVNGRQRFRMGFRAQNQPPALFDIRFRQEGEVPASRHSERLCPGVDSSQEVLGQGNADSRLIWRPILQQFLG